MRRVQYRHTFMHGDDEPREGSLLTFVYDLPYFPPFGVFPPFRQLNEFLSMGTCGGGMSPGAEWEPFAIAQEEYAELVEGIGSTSLEEIKAHAHYALKKAFFDHELDGSEDYSAWFTAACEKYGKRKLPEELVRQLTEAMRKEMRKRQKMEPR